VIEKDGILQYDLDEVLEKCDVLTLHVPLTDSTRNLINLEKMKKMKKSAVILNLARGPVINQEDLYFALKNKIIRSAAVDVTSVEPIEKNSKLFELDNILITPHIAWKSEKSMIKLMDDVEENLKLFLEGKLEGLK
ncbi:2-hydroxyacid dehydrogenase, partial [Leptotrichia buccalis]